MHARALSPQRHHGLTDPSANRGLRCGWGYQPWRRATYGGSVIERKSTLFVGLDEAKHSIAVAIAEPGRGGEVRDYGTIANTPEALTKLVRKLGRPPDLSFAVEAGPCGYETYRHYTATTRCVAAPPPPVPGASGRRYPGRSHWTASHLRWIREQKFSHPAQQICLEEYVKAVEEATERVARLAGQIRELVPQSAAAMTAACDARPADPGPRVRPLRGDQSSIPGHDGVRGDDRRNSAQKLAAERLAPGGQAAALVVRESQGAATSYELLLQDPVLLD